MSADVVDINSASPGASQLENIIAHLRGMAEAGRLRRVVAIAIDTDDNVALLNDGGRKIETIGLLSACQYLLLRSELHGE